MAQVNCVCKRQCAALIDVVRQKEIFDEYHSLSWSRQTKFLREIVNCKRPDKENVNPSTKLKKKEWIRSYFLKNDQGIKHRVCLFFLLKLLQVSHSKIFRAVNSKNTNPSAVDRRGLFPSRKAKFNDAEFLKNFIENIPQYESTYSKSRSHAKVLHPDLNITKLYKIYQTNCETDQRKVMSLSYFKKAFKKFDFTFAKYRTPTCFTCSYIASKQKRSVISLETREMLEQKKDEHLCLAKNVVNEFDKEVRKARYISDENTEVFTFQLGQSIDFPKIEPVDYMKQRLWLHQLGIFDEVRMLSYVYIWPESVASKGSQEIASCIIHHLKKTLPPETKQLILYCDPCFGQNRNMNLCVMLQHFLDSWPHPNLISIKQVFFVSGHGFNNCDRSFEEIRKQEKSMEDIFVPLHCIDFINRLKTFWKISATEMCAENLFLATSLKKYFPDKKIVVSGRDISWSNVNSITFERNESFILHIEHKDKYAFDVIFKKSISCDAWSKLTLPKLDSNSRNISRLKYNDLNVLINFIPDEFQSFYKSLKWVDSDIDKDYVFSLRESSDEEEEDKEEEE